MIQTVTLFLIVGVATLLSVSRAARQLRPGVAVERLDACEARRLGDGIDVPEWQAFVREPVLRLGNARRLYV